MAWPILRLFQSGRGNNAVQIVGDNNCVYVGTGRTRLSLEPYSVLAGLGISEDIDILRPSREAVALVGRERELAEAREWLTGGGIRVMATFGGGGTGKTRFARELLKGLNKDWVGGFLSEKEVRRFAALENLSEWTWEKPTLVVMDYAESVRQELKGWLAELALHPTPKHALRILLLERHASECGGWYKDLTDASEHGEAARRLFEPPKPRELSRLAGFEDRLAVLTAGLERLAVSGIETSERAKQELAGLGKLAGEAEFRTKLMAEAWGDPLFLLMAAVEATYRGVMGALSLTRTAVAGEIAKRQVVFLSKGVEGPARRLRLHLAVCGNLCDGLRKEQLLEVAEEESRRLRIRVPEGAGWLVEELAGRLGVNGREDWVLPRYDPDWLTEAFLLEAGCDAETVKAMARRDLGAVAKILRLTAQNFESSEDGKEEHRPVEWLEVVLEDEALTYEMLQAFETALEMSKGTVALLGLRVKLFRKMLERVEGSDVVERARVLNNLSTCESAVGDRAGSLQSIREAVEIYRVLHGANPDAFASDLAMSLNNLSTCESAVGDRAGSLQSIREAVEIRRGLHGANPDAFASDLASSLNNLSTCESAVGDRAGALRSIREAVEIYRVLHGANPDAFASDLAMSLSVLGDRLDENDLKVEAREAAEESLRVLRADFERLPTGFRGFEKITVEDYWRRSEELGLAVDEELVGVYRGLFEKSAG